MSDNPISKDTQNGELARRHDELGRKLRTSMLITLIFFGYTLLVVLSTTDMLLLREGMIALPIIQVGVPVVAFYRITPLLLVLLHIHLLAKLILFAREIYGSGNSELTSLKASGRYGDGLIVLFSLDPERFLTEMKSGSSAGNFIRIFFLIIFGTTPLLVLLILQASFLAYQNVLFTGSTNS